MLSETTLAEIRRRIAINEGCRNTVYKDSVGIPTIGIGFNLQRSDARRALNLCGADYNAVMSGAALTQEQIDKLFDYSLYPILSDARASLAPGVFDSLSPARQCVIVDLVYNLGFAGWMDFTHTRSLINQAVDALNHHDPNKAHALFGEAADHLATSAWYEQVGNRAKRDVAMMRSSTWVDPTGDGTA